MFTIAHLSDLHQGYASGRKRSEALGLNIRENDGYKAFEKVVDQIITDGTVDCVIISGDIFHVPHPKVHTVIHTQEQLRKLSNAEIKVYMIAGNHDATDIRLDPPANRLLHSPETNVFSYSEPYVETEVADSIYLHLVSHQMYMDQEENFKGMQLRQNAVNILVTHGSCYDTNMNILLHTEQSPREVVIPQAIMKMDWDYTFLGHIHERGWVGSKDGKTDTAKRKQFYNGSLLRRGFSDKECELGRGWTKWAIDTETKKFTPTFFVVEERPQFDMPPINAIDKTAKDIEKEILKQLKQIIKKVANDRVVSEDKAPIVRQTIIGINPKTNLSINWGKFVEFQHQFLIHRFKIIHENEVLQSLEISNIAEAKDIVNANTDIVDVFKSWLDDDEAPLQEIEEAIREDVAARSADWLKAGQEAILAENQQDD